MKVNAIPYDVGLAAEPTSKDPLTKKSPSGELVKQVPVELNLVRDSKQAVRPVVNGLGLELKFSVDKDTNVTVVKVVDSETGEVVRQIPPEEILNFMRQFEKTGSLLSRWI